MLSLDELKSRDVTAAVAQAVGPSVAHLRQTVFGSEDPPFSSWLVARRWLGREDRTVSKQFAAKHRAALVLVGRFQRQWRALGGDEATQLRIESQPRFLILPRMHRKTKVICAPRSTALGKLAEGVAEIATALSAPQKVILQHVLTGEPALYLPKGEIGLDEGEYPLPGGRRFVRSEVRLTLRREPFTEYDRRRVARYLKGAFKQGGDRRMVIRRLVERRGGVPLENIVAFWRGIVADAERLGLRFGGRQAHRWRLARQTYIRNSGDQGRR
jgi:hypothetical protein